MSLCGGPASFWGGLSQHHGRTAAARQRATHPASCGRRWPLGSSRVARSTSRACSSCSCRRTHLHWPGAGRRGRESRRQVRERARGRAGLGGGGLCTGTPLCRDEARRELDVAMRRAYAQVGRTDDAEQGRGGRGGRVALRRGAGRPSPKAFGVVPAGSAAAIWQFKGPHAPRRDQGSVGRRGARAHVQPRRSKCSLRSGAAAAAVARSSDAPRAT